MNITKLLKWKLFTEYRWCIIVRHKDELASIVKFLRKYCRIFINDSSTSMYSVHKNWSFHHDVYLIWNWQGFYATTVWDNYYAFSLDVSTKTLKNVGLLQYVDWSMCLDSGARHDYQEHMFAELELYNHPEDTIQEEKKNNLWRPRKTETLHDMSPDIRDNQDDIPSVLNTTGTEELLDTKPSYKKEYPLVEEIPVPEIESIQEQVSSRKTCLKSSVAGMWRYVTQVTWLIGWFKKTWRGVDTSTIEQSEYTKFKVKKWYEAYVRSDHVSRFEIHPEEE